MSVVNSIIRDAVAARGFATLVLDTSPSSGSRGPIERVRRALRVLIVLGRLTVYSLNRPVNVMYLSVSGGVGQLYDVAFVLLARVRGWSILLHHHSYRYLSRTQLRTRLLAAVAGDKTLHITLCADMASRLRRLYPRAKRVTIVSNAAVLASVGNDKGTQHTRVRRVGFLGTVSLEKGIGQVLEVARRLEERRASVDVWVAGPFETRRMTRLVEGAVRSSERLVYVGPKYDAEKSKFLRDIDVLLFPSQYIHEAEPLTVYEALAQGVPVVALQRGCVAETLTGAAGLVIDAPEAFVDAAVDRIIYWIEHPEEYQVASREAAARLRTLEKEYRQSLDAVLAQLGSR